MTRRIEPSARTTTSGTDAIRRVARIRPAIRLEDVAIAAAGRTPDGQSATTSSSRATIRDPSASNAAASQPPTTTQATAMSPTAPVTTTTWSGTDPNATDVSVGPKVVPSPTVVGS